MTPVCFPTAFPVSLVRKIESSDYVDVIFPEENDVWWSVEGIHRFSDLPIYY